MKIVSDNSQIGTFTSTAIMNKVRMGNYLITNKKIGNRTEYHFTDKSCIEIVEYNSHYVITDFKGQDIKAQTAIQK